MTDLPLGMKYYLLILTSSLIEDLNDYGVKWIANEPGIALRDVEKAFFSARAIEARLPDEPWQADPRLWPDLMKSIHTIRRVLDVVEKTTFDAVIAEAMETTSNIARADLQQVFEKKRAAGEIDFRLHGVLNTQPEVDEPDPAVKEAFMLKRARRFQAFMAFEGESLNEEEQVILDDAKTLARHIMDGDRENRQIDALLVMGAVLIETSSVRLKTNIPGLIRDSFDRMATKAAMALGAIVYRDRYREFKRSLGLEPLNSDL
ncbi:hypothetical protein QPM17_20310 [Marinobacter sp. TBZ242]|uniref:Uncharacterized protein n=1 Tax=Marinobacter azerbaijanicus TaxID=3050455 RepID=A0ABT7IH68_9GAMM|nr:hypothetical protein [Marinobacter sp. TBZ242]MDL0433491.1 hypothetical protein [Marinobacter sp. TBZ242]